METHAKLLKPPICYRYPNFIQNSINFPSSNFQVALNELHCRSVNVKPSLRLRMKNLVYAYKPEITTSTDIDDGGRWLLQSVDFDSTDAIFIDEKHYSPNVATLIPPTRYTTFGDRASLQHPYLVRKLGSMKTKARRRKDPSTKKKGTPVGLKWSSPESPWVKINTDGCSKGSPGNSAAGGLIRDWEGEWKVGFSGNLGIRDSLMAELEGAAFGLELAWNRGFRNVILETDSTAVVEYLLKEVAVPSQYGDLVKKCEEWKSKEWDCRVQHVKRDANICADKLANKALKRAAGWIVFDDPPQEVAVELELDRGGFTWPKWDKF